MGIKEYRDFVLVADGVESDKAGFVKRLTISVFDSPVGQGEKKETVTLPDGLLALIGSL